MPQDTCEIREQLAVDSTPTTEFQRSNSLVSPRDNGLYLLSHLTRVCVRAHISMCVCCFVFNVFFLLVTPKDMQWLFTVISIL